MVVFKKVADIDFGSLFSIVNFQTYKIFKYCCCLSKRSFELSDRLRGDFKLMASIPQAAFAACKLNGYNEKEMTISKVRMNSEMPDMRNNLANKKLLEYSPVKYNSKLMNSIWGLYNRYSPHNIKGNEYEAENRGFKKQQPLAVASYAIDKNLSMAHKSGNEWNFP